MIIGYLDPWGHCQDHTTHKKRPGLRVGSFKGIGFRVL